MTRSPEPRNKRPPWVIVAGGVHQQGGMDKANLALVKYLLEKNTSVYVVTHRIDKELRRDPGVQVILVPVPGGARIAGGMLLSLRGRQVAHRITQRHPEARVVVNGGNCLWGDINWVHRVHHAWSPERVAASPIHKLKHRIATAAAKRGELRSLRAARLIVANSKLTKRHIVELIRVAAEKIHVVQLGSESEWCPAGDSERLTARIHLGLVPSRPVVTFIGAIGYDNNKGLDILLSAWRQLCSNSHWDADLIVAGDGRALPQWRAIVAQSDFSNRVRFLGFTDCVPQLLAASDLVVSPVRYESYGLNVQEALCRGIPAIVSGGAGIAERYPPSLRALLLPDPEDVDDLVHRMLMWRAGCEHWRAQTIEFSRNLRTYSWRDMAERFYELAVRRISEPSESTAELVPQATGE